MRGFTLIEVIIAVFLLTVGAVGVFSMVNQALSSSDILASRLVASYLAQEGIEIARNSRDGNWLRQRAGGGLSWTAHLPQGDRRGDYQTTGALSAYTDNYLVIDGNGFYGNGPGGTDTRFKRKIHIEYPSAFTIEVTVTVYWAERGRNHEFTAREVLYNWR